MNPATRDEAPLSPIERAVVTALGALVHGNRLKKFVASHLTRIDGWRALLTKRTLEGRQLLREVLAGPLRFTPEGRTLVAVRGIEPRFDG